MLQNAHPARRNYRPQHLAHMEQRGVMPLDLLTPEAQLAAIENIRATDRFHYQQAIASSRAIIKSDLHAAINIRCFIPLLVRRANHLRRIERDEQFCRRYILENMCEFTPDGQYRPLIVQAVNVRKAGG